MTRKTLLSALALAAVAAAPLTAPLWAQTAPPPAAAEAPAAEPPAAAGMRLFDRFDADGDGTVTRQEFDAARAAEAAGLDADRDGKLSVTELADRKMARMAEMARMKAQAMVDGHDADGDGLLSVGELALGSQMPRMMFDRLDGNGDGSVTQDEVQALRGAMMGRDGGMRGQGGMRGGRGGAEGRGHGAGRGHGDGSGHGALPWPFGGN